MKPELVLELIIIGVTRINELALLYQKSRSEGRDVSKEELDALDAKTQAAIDAIRKP